MPNIRQPRSGSLQFWPRRRAKRVYARIRTSPEMKEAGLVGFAGYKAGMTHVSAVETNKHSHRKGENISIPVTMVECPPMRIASVRFYKKRLYGTEVKKEVFLVSKDKGLSKKLKLPKKDLKKELESVNPGDYDDVKVLVYTQPTLVSSIEKKKADVIEMGLGGSSVEEKLAYIKENIDKDIFPESVFKEGEIVDIKAVTKGKGFQGPVKRFGISIRQAKSEKAIRNPGSLGPWSAQGHIMWRVAHAGKMGYHQRTEYNKQILKFVDSPEEVNPKGGILGYGKVNSKVLLVKGSVAGPKKRIVLMMKPIRAKQMSLPTIKKISVEEKQGN